MVKEFIGTIQNRKISFLEKDRLVWRKEKDGSFSAKSCFEILEGGKNNCFSKKEDVEPVCPTKIGFFIWEGWWDKVLAADLTRDRRKRSYFSY